MRQQLIYVASRHTGVTKKKKEEEEIKKKEHSKECKKKEIRTLLLNGFINYSQPTELRTRGERRIKIISFLYKK